MRYRIAIQPSRRILILGMITWVAGLAIIIWQASESDWILGLLLAWSCYGVLMVWFWYRAGRLTGEYDDKACFYPAHLSSQIWQISPRSRVSDWGMVIVMAEIRPGSAELRHYVIWRDSIPEADFRRLARICHQLR